MKKLLLLGGAGAHSKVVETAKEMGVYTIVTDYLDDSPAKKIADEALMYNIFDIEDLVAFGEKNKIDGVLGFCIDPTQKPAQVIAERLGLPVFGDAKQVLTLTNKKVFKNFCMQNEVDVILEYQLEDLEKNTMNYPVIVKPIDSRGSRGASICYDKEAVLDALPAARTASSNGEVMVEKYMDSNQDLTITYLVKDGVPYLISIGDRYSGKEEDNLSRQLICTIQPSRYTEMYMKYVDAKVKKMIQKLGIKNGPVFMQGFVDGKTVRMYDPGIRFPGNEYERIFLKATGINVMESIISYVTGGEIENFGGKLSESYKLNGKCAIQYMFNVGPGKIEKIKGLEEIKQFSFVLDVQQRHFEGDIIEATGDIRHRAGEISILVDYDAEQMKYAIEEVQKKLCILNEKGENMLISPFDVEMLEKNYVNKSEKRTNKE